MKNCVGSVPSSASQSSSYLIWERNPTLKAVSAPRELLGARHSEKRVETFSPIFIDLRENSSWEEMDWSKSLD